MTKAKAQQIIDNLNLTESVVIPADSFNMVAGIARPTLARSFVETQSRMNAYTFAQLTVQTAINKLLRKEGTVLRKNTKDDQWYTTDLEGAHKMVARYAKVERNQATCKRQLMSGMTSRYGEGMIFRGVSE